MRLIYFAYGSNMLQARLRARCPSAIPLGIAKACGYRLEFTKKGIDGSGKATLVASEAGCDVPGFLYEISDEDSVKLDIVEGVGMGYERRNDFSVETQDGLTTAMTYLAIDTDSDLIPYDWYLALVVAGIHENDLGKDHIDLVRAQHCKPDPEIDRITRHDALRAFEEHGYSDFKVLLPR